MDNLIAFIDSTMTAAEWSCTQCLIDYLDNESFEMPGGIAALVTAHAARGISPEHEEAFTAALQEFLTRVTEMAVFTAELMRRPGIRWADESAETVLPVIDVSPN